MANYCCGQCERLETGRTYYGDEYYCPKDGKTHKLSSKACDYIIKNRDLRDAEAKEWHKSGWKFYIVTIISKIIKEIYGTDFELLPTLSKIRSEYLANHPDGEDTLEDYDLFGPMIADLISKSPNRDEIAAYLTTFFLFPAVDAIIADDFETATSIYMNMVTMLKVSFNLVNVAAEPELQQNILLFDSVLTRKRPNNNQKNVGN